MENSAVLEAIKIILVCLLWYTSSASGNVIGKLVLNEFPYPMTLTMVQLTSGALYLGPFLTWMKVPKAVDLPKRYYMTMIIPLALGKFVASVSSHISIWKVSVSYAHTVKATLPLFTVILTRVFLGEKQTLPVYVSLLPIIGGVIVATLTEISFDMVGLMSALFATLGFSLQTIFSKKVLNDTGIHQMRLLLVLCRLSALCFLPIWLLCDVTRILQDQSVIQSDRKLQAIWFLLMDGLLNLLQNVFAFTMLAMVATLSYAVANATKRVVIIGASLVLLKNPVTTTNICGMLIAIFGVLLYNKAKYEQNRARRRAQTLPLVKSDTDLLHHVTQPLPHSKSQYSLANGFTDHLLLRDLHPPENVTLMPVSEHTGPYERVQNGDVSHDLHSRANIHHV